MTSTRSGRIEITALRRACGASPMQEFGRKLHHQTPGWVRAGPLFHIRVRAATTQRIMLSDASLAPQLLDAAKRYHQSGRWWCELFLLMPDHVHALIAFPVEPGLSATIRDWKRGTARFQSVAWQENFFDHRIRSPAELAEKWHYIRRNPVAKDLCADEDYWRWWWSGSLGGAR